MSSSPGLSVSHHVFLWEDFKDHHRNTCFSKEKNNHVVRKCFSMKGCLLPWTGLVQHGPRSPSTFANIFYNENISNSYMTIVISAVSCIDAWVFLIFCGGSFSLLRVSF